MKKLVELLYYGGISSDTFHNIEEDVHAANRRSVIAYATISLLGFLGVLIYASFQQNAFTENIEFYILGVGIMAILLFLNLIAYKKRPFVVNASAYLFVMSLFGIGIMLAFNGIEDVTASYMVFLFVAPLLFTLKPIMIDIMIVVSNILYGYLMYRYQVPELFQKNIVNAIIYGILSIFVCTTMIRMRMQKFATDYMNRLLMETDQLTGLLNRRSFEQHIQMLKEKVDLEGMKLCAFDVNGLKHVNDNIGHHAGDELLRGAAACLQNVLSNYGHCYRIGGDEFIAILQENSPTEKELLDMIQKQTVSFKGTFVPGLSISCGIVTGKKGNRIDELLREADIRMYSSKAKYYSGSGIDRRKR